MTREGLTLYLDCFSGISGDMFVGALLDLGASEERVRAAVDALALPGCSVKIGRRVKDGIAGTDFTVLVNGGSPDAYTRLPNAPDWHAHENTPHVHLYDGTDIAPDEESEPGGAGISDWHAHECTPHVHLNDESDSVHEHGDAHAHDEGGHAHRTHADIIALLRKAPLDAPVRVLALRVFDAIARAEAAIHGVDVRDVTFHEVGAVDSIVDIVAAAACVVSLAPVRVFCSRLTEGTGFARTAHGLLPVPVPATAELLRMAGAPLRVTETPFELVTPTGAGLATVLAEGYGPAPAGVVAAVGYGCGKRDTGRPNLLRAMLIDAGADTYADRVAVLETCVDDCTGEALACAAETLLQAGARDAYYTPVLMKKGRPAWQLTVLCDEDEADRFTRLVFSHTTAIGLRLRVSERRVMARMTDTVMTPYGEVRVKRCAYDGIVKCKPELDDLVAAAGRNNVPVDAVRRAAERALDETVR